MHTAHSTHTHTEVKNDGGLLWEQAPKILQGAGGGRTRSETRKTDAGRTRRTHSAYDRRTSDPKTQTKNRDLPAITFHSVVFVVVVVLFLITSQARGASP